MKLPVKLPPELAAAAVKTYPELSTDKIIAYCICDLSENQEYKSSLLMLFSDKIIHIPYDSNENAHVFAGYIGKGAKLMPEVSCGEPAVHLISDITEADIENMVIGGRIWVDINAERLAIGYFSNLHGGDVRLFVKLLKKLIAREEITEKDYNDEFKREYCPTCGAAYPEADRKICPKCMDKRTVLLRLLSFFTPYKKQLAFMFLCILIVSGLSMLWPLLSGKILNDTVLSKNAGDSPLFSLSGGDYGIMLLYTAGAMIAAKFLQQLFGIIQGYILASLVPEVIGSIKNKVFSAMGRLSLKFFTSKQTGALMTRVLDDANEVTGFFFDGLPYAIVNVLTVISSVTVMLILNWRLAMITVILLPALTIISALLGPRWWMLFNKRHRAVRGLNSVINDNITGARVVKAFGREKNEVRRFQGYNRQVREADMKSVVFENQFNALFLTVESIIQITVWFFGSLIVLNLIGGGEMSYGVLASFAGYVTALIGPLDFFSYLFRWANYSLSCGSRIFEICDAVPDITEQPGAVELKDIKGKIEFKGVTFAYEANRNVLESISLLINPGEVLGIVGKSGAGKSTLVSLITRLYDPYEGSVLLDDINLKDISFKSLYGNVAVVSQETYIFMGTVAENIAYSTPDACRDDIIRAAYAAAAHDFICKMPDGYDTVIGAGGRDLSGGERQRLSIARAILADPKVLILDEATASVDTKTERSIQASLNELTKNRTTISIAHRLSTLKNATHLVVIDDGKIVERGTHAELMEKQGEYHKLVDIQRTALAMRGIED